MERDILHLSIPAFPVALARVADPSLRQRPVAVAPAHSERALLQCVSREARNEGVSEGMPVYRARRLCPSLTLMPPDPALVGRGTRALLDVSGHYSPLCEPASQGRLFLDMTGCSRLFGPSRDVAARLDREIAARLRLAGTIGVASNKLVSRIASGYLEDPGVCDVLRGSEKTFLAPLPVCALPGVGRSRQSVLMQDLNLKHIGEVAELSIAQLRLAFGPFAPLLHQRACGFDPSPVQPPRRTPEVSEGALLGEEENDDHVLLAELCRLVEACGLQLRRRGRSAGRIALSVTFADGVAVQRTATLRPAVNHDLMLFEAAEELFDRACQRRVRVKGLKLSCSGLSVEKRQLDLFAAPDAVPPRQEALQGTLDRLREKYGMDSVRWGRTFQP